VLHEAKVWFALQYVEDFIRLNTVLGSKFLHNRFQPDYVLNAQDGFSSSRRDIGATIRGAGII
jgi:hypothetical protein